MGSIKNFCLTTAFGGGGGGQSQKKKNNFKKFVGQSRTPMIFLLKKWYITTEFGKKGGGQLTPIQFTWICT